MKIWKVLIKKEELFYYSLNWLVSLFKFFEMTWPQRRRLHKSNSRLIKSAQRRDRVLVVMNGPSVAEQDFSLLEREDVIFANRGFKHPLYAEIQPKYHVFVDTKFKKGIWPVSWLDEILEMVPDITFMMPASWSKLDFMQPYIKRGVKFLWLFDNHYFVGGMSVAGSAIRGAIKVGYRNIYITGFDKTDFIGQLLKRANHFYGANEEDNSMTYDDYTQGFLMNFLFYISAKNNAVEWAKEGINVVNVTRGGLVEAFKRDNFEEVFAK